MKFVRMPAYSDPVADLALPWDKTGPWLEQYQVEGASLPLGFIISRFEPHEVPYWGSWLEPVCPSCHQWSSVPSTNVCGAVFHAGMDVPLYATMGATQRWVSVLSGTEALRAWFEPLALSPLEAEIEIEAIRARCKEFFLHRLDKLDPAAAELARMV